MASGWAEGLAWATGTSSLGCWEGHAGLSGVSLQALTEEKVAYDRSPSKNIYLSVAVNALKRLRGLAPGPVPGVSSKPGLGWLGRGWALGPFLQL